MMLFEVLDEQVVVAFTGRINVLDQSSREFLGAVYLKNGEVIETKYAGASGEKSFYRLVTHDFNPTYNYRYIVEPELVSEIRKIHYPYSVLKRRASKIVEELQKSISLRPPNNLKLIINSEILTNDTKITETEFRLLSTISDYSEVEKIYENSSLLDFEITNSLVSLRKKRALKVIGRKA